jgi:hypothetical protein
MPDINEGDSVSPPWAKMRGPPLVRSARTTREPRESAAALAVEHHLVRHQIDVIDQNKSNARGCGWFRRTDAG